MPAVVGLRPSGGLGVGERIPQPGQLGCIQRRVAIGWRCGGHRSPGTDRPTPVHRSAFANVAAAIPRSAPPAHSPRRSSRSSAARQRSPMACPAAQRRVGHCLPPRQGPHCFPSAHCIPAARHHTAMTTMNRTVYADVSEPTKTAPPICNATMTTSCTRPPGLSCNAMAEQTTPAPAAQIAAAPVSTASARTAIARTPSGCEPPRRCPASAASRRRRPGCRWSLTHSGVNDLARWSNSLQSHVKIRVILGIFQDGQ